MVAFASVPLVALAWRAATGGLGANPIETVTHVTGDWSLRLLLLTLAVTPARRLLGLAWLAPLRRALGLATFSTACLHLLTFLVLEHFFDWQALLEDVLERRYVALGFAAFLCLVPLAVTSTRGWQRRLGRRWVRLHRAAYLAAVLGVAHHLWLVKADLRAPLVHAGVLALLLATRLWRPGRRLSFPGRGGRGRPLGAGPPARRAGSEGSEAPGPVDPR